MTRTTRSLILGSILLSAIGFSACSEDSTDENGTGGTDTGGKATGTGGRATGTGGRAIGTGGKAVGGTAGIGGVANGGAAGSGNGGAATGGRTNGGAATGGRANGGTAGAPGTGGAMAGAPGAGGAMAGAPGIGGAMAGAPGTGGARAGAPGTGGAAAGAAGIPAAMGGAAAGSAGAPGTGGASAGAGTAGAAGAPFTQIWSFDAVDGWGIRATTTEVPLIDASAGTTLTTTLTPGIATWTVPFVAAANTAITQAALENNFTAVDMTGKTITLHIRWVSGGVGVAAAATGGFDVFIVASDADLTAGTNSYVGALALADRGTAAFKSFTYTVPVAAAPWEPAAVRQLSIRLASRYWTADPQPVFDYTTAVFEIDAVTY